MLGREMWPAWLGEENPTDPPRLKALLAPGGLLAGECAGWQPRIMTRACSPYESTSRRGTERRSDSRLFVNATGIPLTANGTFVACAAGLRRI